MGIPGETASCLPVESLSIPSAGTIVRRARLRLKAREIVAAHERGETVDQYSLEWAQFVDRNNRPAAGWLGEQTAETP